VATQLFDVFDSDGSGDISFRELHRLLRNPVHVQVHNVTAAKVILPVDVPEVRKQIRSQVLTMSMQAEMHNMALGLSMHNTLFDHMEPPWIGSDPHPAVGSDPDPAPYNPPLRLQPAVSHQPDVAKAPEPAEMEPAAQESAPAALDPAPTASAQTPTPEPSASHLTPFGLKKSKSSRRVAPTPVHES
jgi:hypothetical protein